MERIEIQRGRMADGNLTSADERSLLKQVSGSVLDIHGGIGLISEYLSSKGCEVTLLEDEHLAHSYRRNLCKDSKVKIMRVNADDFKLRVPSYDYVIVRFWGHIDMARQLAKQGVVNLMEMKVEKVNGPKPVDSPKIERENSEDSGVVASNEESESSTLYTRTDE